MKVYELLENYASDCIKNRVYIFCKNTVDIFDSVNEFMLETPSRWHYSEVKKWCCTANGNIRIMVDE